MRRLFAAFLLCLLAGLPVAQAQDLPWDKIFAETDALNPDGLVQDLVFDEAGPWLSVTVTQRGMIAPRFEGTQQYGRVFSMADGSLVTWDQVFIDGDAAAERMEALAEAASQGNAYSEYNAVTPMPRDNFTVSEDLFTVYYPAPQLSHFSGLSGGFSFFAYELEGLLAEDVPLKQGDIAKAEEAVRQALETGTLPGALAGWPLGTPMQEAADKLGLVDLPDFGEAHALWRFEDPLMQGAMFLSAREDAEVVAATITGIRTTHYDLSGLQTGRTTLQECQAALEGLSPEVDSLWMIFRGDTHTLTLRFEEHILHSIELTANG